MCGGGNGRLGGIEVGREKEKWQVSEKKEEGIGNRTKGLVCTGGPCWLLAGWEEIGNELCYSRNFLTPSYQSMVRRHPTCLGCAKAVKAGDLVV